MGEFNRTVIDTTSAGYIGGWVIAPFLVMLGVVWLLKKGFQGNDKFLYFGCIASRYPILTLTYRFGCMVLGLVAVGFAFDHGNVTGFAFYTNWNWLLLTIYFIMGTAISGIRAFRPQMIPLSGDAVDTPHGDEVTTKNIRPWVHILFVAHQLVGEIEIPSAILVTIVFWVVLSDGGGFDDFQNVTQHLANSFMMLLDFAIGSWMFNGRHFVLSLIWPGLFLIFALIFSVTPNGFVPYGFLNTNELGYLAWVVGLALFGQLLFWGCYGLSKLKQRYLLEIPDESDNKSNDIAPSSV